MGESLGQMQIGLSKLPHGSGVDVELMLRYVNDRYQSLLDFHPWTRLNKNSVVQVPTLGPTPNNGQYATGTVAINSGATSLTLTGGTWTAAMNGLRIRIANRSEFYTFTYISATTGSIDRAYEDPNNQTAASYVIWQAIYTLPTDLDFIQSISCPRLNIEMDQTTQEQLDLADPGRWLGSATEGPAEYAPYQDSSGGFSQIELYPGPVIAEGLPMRYRSKVARFLATDTAKTFLDWVDTEVIFAGVEADLYGIAGNWQGKQAKEADWVAGLDRMVTQDNQRIAPAPLRMANRYVQHRVDRSTGGDSLRWTRWLRM